MATIRELSNGRFRTDIRSQNTFIQSKTFNTKKQAEANACEVETNIDSILI